MAILIRPKSHIFGLTAELADIVNNAALEVTNRTAADNTLENIVTTEFMRINAATEALDTATLKKSANLSDVADAAVARANLAVDSAAEVDAKITVAKLALGTRFVVSNLAARDALRNLDVADSVFVENNGNDWVIYQPADVDGTGAAIAWIVLTDAATYLNANSAAAIKASYESNADTNAFTDAEQAKVGFVSVTAAIDLDKVIQSDELLTDVTLAGATNTQIASAAAVKAFVQAAANAGGAVFKAEWVPVTGDRITLSFKPKDGMILNFGTVRHIDVNNVAYDIPAFNDGTDVTGKTYMLVADSVGQFDGKLVLAQYPSTL